MSVLTAAPESIGEIPVIPTGAPIAGPATGSPFLVEGERSFVLGLQLTSVGRVAIDGATVLDDLETNLGSAANLVLYPGVARREIAGPGGTSLETVIAAPTLPFVVVQWSGPIGALPDLIRFRVPRASGRSEPVREARGFAVTTEDGDTISVIMVPGPQSITFSEGDSGDLEVAFRRGKGGTATLVVAAGDPGTVATSLAAATHLPGHALRAARGPIDGGLELATGVAELDEGFSLARVRLHNAVRRLTVNAGLRSQGPAATSDSDRAGLLLGLAALVSGDPDGVSRAIAAGGVRNVLSRALLSARLAATTGQSSQALRIAEELLGAGPLTMESGQDLAAFVRSMLADGLRHSAPESMIAELRRPLAASDRSPRGGDTGNARALPMAGSSSHPDEWVVRLDSLLKGDPVAGGSLLGSVPPTVRGSAAAFRSAPDAAWMAWRSALSEGFSGGPCGPGSWDPIRPDGDGHAATASELVLALGHGMLGIAQDAPAGRIRIAPRLPSHLTRFKVAGIALGDSTVRLEYHRSDKRHSFTLSPDTASVPPLAVFEPMVPGAVVGVTVDGSPADLELSRGESYTSVPIQLPIDGERTVEITTA